MHWSTPQDAEPSQLGPPSVARSTTVRPLRAARPGARAVSVAAVGVPPAGSMLVAAMKPPVVGPVAGEIRVPGTAEIPAPLSSDATSVQRVNTGGEMAQGRCETAGEYLSVPYAADYLFLHKG